MFTSIIINPGIDWVLCVKSSTKMFCFYDFRSEKVIFVANDKPLKICILSRDSNMVNLKRNVTNASMSKFKLMFAKYLNKDGKLKAQKIRLIDTPIHPERP